MKRKTLFEYPGRCYFSGYFLKCDVTCKYHPKNPTVTPAKCTEEEIGDSLREVENDQEMAPPAQAGPEEG